MEKVYCIKGFNTNGDRRYIQLGDTSGAPEVTTRTGYRRYNQIVFTAPEEAAMFLYNFERSDKRRIVYPIDWKICEYKPLRGLEYAVENITWTNDRRSVKRMKFTRKPMAIDTNCGKAYKLVTYKEEC